ncbi:MAG TPA: alpha-L-rhamnosidase C-terminal domain-containing protein [Verrucomicrobiae bacterium]|nr:alpha-L-rhamnosidase C-terminal domain-containing protein [Verrucomicrobiae bacterium]
MQKQFSVCVIAAALSLCAYTASAQSPASLHSEFWKAQWITAADAPQRDEVVLHFRKTIDLPAAVQRFVVQVSADNQFVLYVNGKRVGAGPSHSDLAHWHYETFDLAPFLHRGKNLLAATVWNFGVRSAVSQMSDRTGFLMHGDTDTERAADTDATWQVEREYGIATFRPAIGDFYFAAGPGERIDGAKFDWMWDREPSPQSGAWTQAVTLGRGALRSERDAPNNWQLVADPLPPMEYKSIPIGNIVRATGIDKPVAFPCVVPAHSKATLLLDQSELVTAYPELLLTSGAGSRIRLTYAAALYDDKGEKGNRNEIAGKHIKGTADEFAVGPGAKIQSFGPLSWRTWRFLQLDIETADDDLSIDALNVFFTAYPFEETAYFHSHDATLTNIWNIGWRTARLDAHDTYMDTPYWERLQYIGDTRIQALISYAVAADDRLAQQAIAAFNHSRVPDGLTQSRYPSNLVQMIPTFSLLWIGMVHDFWLYRDDTDFVRRNLPGTRTVLDWYLQRQRPDGLLGKIPWWPFVDWGKDFDFGEPPQQADGGSAVITLQFVEALRYAAELEDQYGDHHLAEDYRAAASRASHAIWKLCWNDKFQLLADTPEQTHFSQHANILGVWLDVIPRDHQTTVLNKILSASENLDGGNAFQAQGPVPPMTLATYYFRFYLARAIEHAGMGDLYLQLLQPWHQMVNLGLTTWAESPEPTRSDSHAWSAHPNYDLLTIVAGIHPDAAGFAKVRIEPHLGSLDELAAAMPTVKGTVQVRYKRLPTGLRAEVILPLALSGKFLWEGAEKDLHPGQQILTLEGKK